MAYAARPFSVATARNNNSNFKSKHPPDLALRACGSFAPRDCTENPKVPTVPKGSRARKRLSAALGGKGPTSGVAKLVRKSKENPPPPVPSTWKDKRSGANAPD
ncbi:nucleotidyltransferase [Anopheles sinensis]|uniref:Nucleotidyltransferase n=1 Tax=Anopheles sinensis TaxID=74873 RepID=A0A084WRF9_ANOSI|nr:nucleotidyltransferase [Anopheles sinensis]